METVLESSPVIASDHRERGNLYCLKFDEIASVVSLPRNDIVTQLQDERGYSTKEIGTRAQDRGHRDDF